MLSLDDILHAPILHNFMFHSVEGPLFETSVSFCRKISAILAPFWLFKHVVRHCQQIFHLFLVEKFVGLQVCMNENIKFALRVRMPNSKRHVKID